MERLVNFGQNNKRGGRQKSPKLISGEVGINGEAGKNTKIISITVFCKTQHNA